MTLTKITKTILFVSLIALVIIPATNISYAQDPCDGNNLTQDQVEDLIDTALEDSTEARSEARAANALGDIPGAEAAKDKASDAKDRMDDATNLLVNCYDLTPSELAAVDVVKDLAQKSLDEVYHLLLLTLYGIQIWFFVILIAIIIIVVGNTIIVIRIWRRLPR